MTPKETQRYLEALRKLAGTDGKHVCRHSECRTITLADYCQKHNEEYKRQPLADDSDRSKYNGESDCKSCA